MVEEVLFGVGVPRLVAAAALLAAVAAEVRGPGTARGLVRAARAALLAVEVAAALGVPWLPARELLPLAEGLRHALRLLLLVDPLAALVRLRPRRGKPSGPRGP